MKALKITGAAIAAIIIVIALVLIVGIPSSFVTSAIQERVERATGYRLTIAGTTRLSLWPRLNLTINDVTLQDPGDHDGSNRVTVGSIEADMSLSSVWSGHPQVNALVITKPVIYVPLLRERSREVVATKSAKAAGDAEAVAINRVKIADGAIVFSNPHDRVENRIDGIDADAGMDAEHKLKLAGSARAGTSPLNFDITAEVPSLPLQRQSIPVELRIDAPDLLHAPLSAKTEIRANGSLIMFNGVSGTLGDGAFSGWASVDAASKPLVKVDLDFQRLNVPLAKGAPTSPSQPWSNAPIDFIGLNYLDGEVRISAADANIGEAHFAPAAVEATLAGGVLKAAIANLGTYGGQANGEVVVDATGGAPSFTMHCDLVGVSALPLLTSLADFDKIDGKLQAKIAARSSGSSQQAIMSNLSGTVFADFQDGAIRGLNVAQMIRNLTTNPLSGWQQEKEQSTDLTQLSASFRIDRGQATTSDLNLVGPLVRVTGGGTVDLATKTLGLRVEPKLVMTTQGQGRTSDPVSFGIPVAIEGPWAEPRIYPDIAGMLDNPDAAYAKLREMGEGLFGPNGGLSGLLNGLTGGGNGNGDEQNGLLGGNLGEALGGLIQQGLGDRSRTVPPGSSTQGRGQQQAAPTPPNAGQDGSLPQMQESQPMTDVLRQLFKR
ncbi:AsmA family protein [Bradyrhizobium sp. ARR65]|uniref:AsmA family protein n=1 Tax=Bradyrhizobium sp. ARR65 TaxID=1040989 RepID=UPI0004639255|nr:AsmA family protein [Bradyrhizobium sp. ARR65]